LIANSNFRNQPSSWVIFTAKDGLITQGQVQYKVLNLRKELVFMYELTKKASPFRTLP
jgi:hypothetical protein